MTLIESLGHLGEFIGAIGGGVSLVNLALQLRQNTSSVRAASFNSMVQNIIRSLEHGFADSEFATFLARAESDPESLDAAGRLRWDSCMTSVFRHFGNLVYHQRVGALDEQMWQSYRRDLKEHLRSPAWAEWFREHHVVFSDSLCPEVAELVAQIRAEGTVQRPAAAPSGADPDRLPEQV